MHIFIPLRKFTMGKTTYKNPIRFPSIFARMVILWCLIPWDDTMGYLIHHGNTMWAKTDGNPMGV